MKSDDLDILYHAPERCLVFTRDLDQLWLNAEAEASFSPGLRTALLENLRTARNLPDAIEVAAAQSGPVALRVRLLDDDLSGTLRRLDGTRFILSAQIFDCRLERLRSLTDQVEDLKMRLRHARLLTECAREQRERFRLAAADAGAMAAHQVNDVRGILGGLVEDAGSGRPPAPGRLAAAQEELDRSADLATELEALANGNFWLPRVDEIALADMTRRLFRVSPAQGRNARIWLGQSVEAPPGLPEPASAAHVIGNSVITRRFLRHLRLCIAPDDAAPLAVRQEVAKGASHELTLRIDVDEAQARTDGALHRRDQATELCSYLAQRQGWRFGTRTVTGGLAVDIAAPLFPERPNSADLHSFMRLGRPLPDQDLPQAFV